MTTGSLLVDGVLLAVMVGFFFGAAGAFLTSIVIVIGFDIEGPREIFEVVVSMSLCGLVTGWLACRYILEPPDSS